MQLDTHNIKFDYKLYLMLLVSILLIVFTDILQMALNGQTGYLLKEAYHFTTTIHFIVSPIPYMIWSIYIDFYIHKNVKRTKKRLPIFAIPVLISMFLVIINLYNENNLYQQRDLFLLNIVIYYTYFIGTFFQLLINRKNIKQENYYRLIFFGIVPAALGIIQIVKPTNDFTWIGLSLSALLIYLNIQNGKINKDYLTGLYNRRELDLYLKNAIIKLDKEELLFMMMIDINSFKKINDTYGHLEGDQALIHTANLFTETFRADDFIARYAGDEFIIIAKLSCKSSAKMLVQRLRKNLIELNDRNTKPYDINLSIGYDIYDPALKMNANEFLTHTDTLMYQDKNR